jgi:cobalt/nickel transport system permease protein
MGAPNDIANAKPGEEARVSSSASADAVSTSSVALPAWLAAGQDYQPSSDHDRFIGKNAVKLASLLRRVKVQRGGLGNVSPSILDRWMLAVSPALRLCGILVLIVCTSAAINMFYAYVILATVLVMLAFKPGEAIVDILKPALGAAALAAVIMLPAVFLGQTSSVVRIAVKVFAYMVLLANYSRGYAWNRIIASLRFFHLPSIVVFVFDITLKYIVMLGEVAQGVLEALRLRSVGHNGEKTKSASNVMGVTLLKAKDFSQEMYEAMECRGFTGEYDVPRTSVLNAAGIAYIMVVAVYVLMFFYLEGML